MTDMTSDVCLCSQRSRQKAIFPQTSIELEAIKSNFSIAKGKKEKSIFFVVNAVNEFVIWQIMQSINGRKKQIA